MLYEEYENLPAEVKAILDTYDEDTLNGYEECERINTNLNKIGWQCDYDLSATIFEVTTID